ncbi:MAG: hypothetical protein J6K00_01615 [Oscillospiraceae bacterium]|nr:hypothetical protein [Oscillospiraceae bacterium]
MKRSLWIFVLAAEVIILAAMLLADFGVIGSNTDPLSARGIMLHITAVVVIVASLIGLRRS